LASCSGLINDRERATRLHPILELKNLSKHYGEKSILHDLSLTIDPGEFFAPLGPIGLREIQRELVEVFNVRNFCYVSKVEAKELPVDKNYPL
jgi:ABC-type uncharacterized transport system YnjBCD ATPase subunit